LDIFFVILLSTRQGILKYNNFNFKFSLFSIIPDVALTVMVILSSVFEYIDNNNIFWLDLIF
jgi:hypothetical protein